MIGRILLAAILALAACSEEPVGNSPYFDPWDNSTLNPMADQTLELNRDLQGRRAAQQVRSDDQALVASLESAIASAGTVPAQPVIRQVPDDRVPTTTVTIAGADGQAPVTPQPNIGGSTSISDNSFATVVQKETIETDRAKLEALEGAKVELQAQPLPQRDSNVNLAAFARSTTHSIGQRIYTRSFRGSASKACRKYGNPDAAQRAFLANGGPVRDNMKLDPDGDGFVCGWSPLPFRNLSVGG